MGTRRRRRLAYTEVDPGDSRSFAVLYNIYAQMFPLPDEREPPDAFFEIAALNVNGPVQAAFGPWREVVASIRPWQGGPIIGGHVFGMTTSRAHERHGHGASVQAIYTFIEQRSRGSGAISDMKRYMTGEALRVFGFEADAPLTPLIFFEVNNPLRMTAEQIREDTEMSGVSPFRRYNFWRRNGFRPLDLRYVQPALRPDAEPVRYLDLFCSDVPAGGIASAVIASHLAAFIAVSVRKGAPADEDPDFAAMAAALSARDFIPFVEDDTAEQQAIRAGARRDGGPQS